MLLITFVELRLVAGRRRKWAGRPHAVSGRPMIIHTCHAHAAVCRDLENTLRTAWSWHGMAWARHGTYESNTAAMCKSNWKETVQTLSGTAWARHGNGMVCVN
jgi:hypothetical protein